MKKIGLTLLLAIGLTQNTFSQFTHIQKQAMFIITHNQKSQAEDFFEWISNNYYAGNLVIVEKDVPLTTFERQKDILKSLFTMSHNGRHFFSYQMHFDKDFNDPWNFVGSTTDKSVLNKLYTYLSNSSDWEAEDMDGNSAVFSSSDLIIYLTPDINEQGWDSYSIINLPRYAKVFFENQGWRDKYIKD